MADSKALAGDGLRGGVGDDARRKKRPWNLRLAKAACTRILNDAMGAEDPEFHGNFTFHAKAGRIVGRHTNESEKPEELPMAIDPEDVFS